jgi:peptide/nickel transport system ATP-binding protein
MSLANPSVPPQAAPVVEVDGLHIGFPRDGGMTSVVNGLSFALAQGEIMAILGESGSGKSVTLRALMGMLPPRAQVEGSIVIGGQPMHALPAAARVRLRGRLISMVFQESTAALDPVFSIGEQLIEAILAHENVSRADARRRALELLDMVKIPSPKARIRNYPHEMSGGMRQRATIALALACRPTVLLADEPTTALDVTVQMQILFLLRELRDTLGMTMIIVTHDIGVAAEISDRVAVMYAGRFVEVGSSESVLVNGLHPYTQGLLRSTVHGGMRGKVLDAIPGVPPDPTAADAGCAFAPRCSFAYDLCRTQGTPQLEMKRDRMIACYRQSPQQEI